MMFTEAVSCVLDGITIANQTYEKWSGGDWLNGAGVEGFLVAKIGERLHERSIANISDETVTLETTMGYVGDESGGRAKNKRPSYLKDILGDSQRLDITLWKGETAQGVFEIKRHWSPNGCFNDLLRVAAMVSEHGPSSGGSIQWGFAAFFADRSINAHDGSLDERTSQYQKDIKKRFGMPRECPKWISRGMDLTFKYGPVMQSRNRHGEVEWEGRGVCIAVRPN